MGPGAAAGQDVFRVVVGRRRPRSEMDERELPQAGEVWRHYKGGLYRIVAVADQVEEEGGCKVVAYQNLHDSRIWTQSLRRFMNEREDGWVRFARVGGLRDGE